MSTLMTILTPDTDHSGCLRKVASPVTVFDDAFLGAVNLTAPQAIVQ